MTDEGRGTIAYVIDRTAEHFKMEVTLSAPTTVDLRVGPFAQKPGDVIRVDGIEQAFEAFHSGDSWWGWVRDLRKTKFTVEI